MNISTHKDPLLELRLAQRERPDERPVMYQSWQQLLFLHWRIDPAVIQSILPKGLTVDTYDVDAWVGVVPFLMRNIPSLLGTSRAGDFELSRTELADVCHQ